MSRNRLWPLENILAWKQEFKRVRAGFGSCNLRQYVTGLMLVIGLAHSAIAADAEFANTYDDDMVLQADKPATLWGTAKTGTKVFVDFQNERYDALSDQNGKWQLTLPAQKAGKTGDITLLSEQGETIGKLKNVVFGDVWLCSGQSNMGLRVREAAYPDRTAKEGEGYPIRIMQVAKSSKVTPSYNFKPSIPWSQATEQSLPDFSAVCWEFAKEIYLKTHRPMGLIQSSWGGTMIEDWISLPALKSTGHDHDALSMLELYATSPGNALSQLGEQTSEWAKVNDSGVSGSEKWYSEKINDITWKSLPLPVIWERANIGELANFNGVIWFRKHITVSADAASVPATLRLGKINERDTVWINGQQIGQTFETNVLRQYSIAANTLKAGNNVIAIRVVDERGSGGFSDYPDQFGIYPDNSDAISLRGEWSYKISAEIKSIANAPVVPWMVPRGFTTLNNGMIHPLGPVTLKGILWYQGETNTGYAKRYRWLLPTLMADWRKQFGDNKLPFIVAQLPGFGAYSGDTAPSTWAELRESQRQAVAEDTNAGLAVLLDRGLNNDIHPSHKREPGIRLAHVALNVAYEGFAESESPYPSTVSKQPSSIVVEYPANSSLTVFSGEQVLGFQACRSMTDCKFVSATVSGDTVILDTDPSTVSLVKYAWQDTPIINLFNKQGLPAAPFIMNVTP